MTGFAKPALPDRLTIARWDSPSGRHRPDSPYVKVWLGILGPTSTWAWVLLSRAKDGWCVPTEDLGRTLGVGSSQLQHAVSRLAAFNAARFGPDMGVLHVRSGLPDVPHRLVPRLSNLARGLHDTMAAPHPEDPSPTGQSVKVGVWR